MNKIIVKNALSAIALLIFVMLASGSFNAKVTVDSINKAKSTLRDSLSDIRTDSTKTTAEVDSAYSQLKSYLDKRNISDRNLRNLEDRLTTIQTKYANLEDSFESAKKDGKELFALLNRRAKENDTRELRKRMLKDIGTKEDEFNAKIDKAEVVLSKIEKSIAKYDDIVGFVQVNKGLQGIDDLIADIEATMKVGTTLNSEIRNNIDDGLRLIASL